MPTNFDAREFATSLLAEVLYFDDEHGSIGSVSLIDPSSGKEMYMASFDPELESWLLEEASEWDDEPVEGLLIATDGKPMAEFDDPIEIAAAVIDLAAEYRLSPVFLPLFEEPL